MIEGEHFVLYIDGDKILDVGRMTASPGTDDRAPVACTPADSRAEYDNVSITSSVTAFPFALLRGAPGAATAWRRLWGTRTPPR